MTIMLCVHETPARLFELLTVEQLFVWLIRTLSEIYFAYLFLLDVA